MIPYLFLLFLIVFPILAIFDTFVINKYSSKKDRIFGIALIVVYVVTFAFIFNHHVEGERQKAIVEYKAGYYKESVKKVYVDGTLVKHDTTYKRIKK